MNRTKLERLRGEIVEGGARFVTTEGVLKVLDAMLAGDAGGDPPMTPRCDGCRYWKPLPEWWRENYPNAGLMVGHTLTNGYCRRFPAQVEKPPADWCGEYVGKEGA